MAIAHFNHEKRVKLPGLLLSMWFRAIHSGIHRNICDSMEKMLRMRYVNPENLKYAKGEVVRVSSAKGFLKEE